MIFQLREKNKLTKKKAAQMKLMSKTKPEHNALVGGASALQPKLSRAFRKVNKGQDCVAYACLHIQPSCMCRHTHTYDICSRISGNWILRLENAVATLRKPARKKQ